MKKKGRFLFLSSIMCLTLCVSGCGNDNQKVADEYMAKVEALETADTLPTLEEVQALDHEYYNLTPKQQELVTNYGTVKKFLDLDLDKIMNVQASIDTALTADTNNSFVYSDLLPTIQNMYSSLNSVEQGYIKNYDKIEEMLEESKKLKGFEKAAIVAVRQLQDFLKNPSSLELYDLGAGVGTDEYIIKIEYGASNSLGGMVTDTAYIPVEFDTYEISESFKNDVSLAMINDLLGDSSNFSYSKYKKKYDSSGTITGFDIQKIYDNLSTQIEPDEAGTCIAEANAFQNN